MMSSSLQCIGFSPPRADRDEDGLVGFDDLVVLTENRWGIHLTVRAFDLGSNQTAQTA